MRKPVTAILTIALVALAASVIRVQPSGTATLFRSGSHVVERKTLLYVRARGAACRVPSIGDHLSFSGDAPKQVVQGQFK